jgi:hypothetical protein
MVTVLIYQIRPGSVSTNVKFLDFTPPENLKKIAFFHVLGHIIPKIHV